MRVPLLLALTLSVSLAACDNRSAPPPPPPREPAAAAPPAVAEDAVAIRGRLTIEGLTELPAGLTLNLRLLDVSDPSIAPPVVAQRSEPGPTSVPATYALPYDPASIDEAKRYAVEATLTAEDFVMYATPMPVPVLTQGAPTRIDLELARGGPAASADIAPADIMAGEFERLESSIGGMTRLTGERIENDVTVGWDAFADDSGVRFAREVVDYGKAGTASFRYAFRNGEPWVVAREQGDTLTLVGWAEDGSVQLNRVGDDGRLEDDEIARLRKMAETAYKNAAAKL